MSLYRLGISVFVVGLLLIQVLAPWLVRKPFVARLIRRPASKACPVCCSEVRVKTVTCPHCKLTIP